MSKSKAKSTPLGAAYRMFSEDGCAKVEALGIRLRCSIHRDYFEHHQPLEKSLVSWLDHSIAKAMTVHYFGA